MARFDYFDSFRGILCLSVMIFHLGLETYTLHGFHFGVIGFFVLSAFLLTYRLIKQYESANSILTISKITINYGIMRFFRIYIPYILFFILYKYLFKRENKKSFLNAVMLDCWPRLTHLWTMPIEIRYYFLIPIIAFVSSKFYKYKAITWSLFLLNFVFLVSINKFKLFNIGEDSEISQFNRHLPIFMSGSILALVYSNLIDSNDTNWIEKLNQSKLYSYSIGVLCIYLFWYLCRAHSWYRLVKNDGYLFTAGITIFMFLLLISPSNFMAKYLSKESIFKLYGKYSYGTYLFHYEVVIYLESLNSIKTDKVIYLFISSLFLGILFYYIVENNLIKMANYIINVVNTKISSYKLLNNIQQENL